MKKKILLYSIVIVPLFLIFLIFNFGIEVGNIRIGKQSDLRTIQSSEFKESVFYKGYYSKNNLTILNTWATWCAPCIKEMPVLNKVKADFEDSNIEFISISVDKDSIKLVEFNNSKEFKFKDITIKDLKYRDAILNTLEGKSPDEWISSYIVPITYFIKNEKVLFKTAGMIEEKEFYSLVNKYK
jgi:thiol-disulfide isomerase/thioredoxin